MTRFRIVKLWNVEQEACTYNFNHEDAHVPQEILVFGSSSVEIVASQGLGPGVCWMEK
jgi:hypothetical protein